MRKVLAGLLAMAVVVSSPLFLEGKEIFSFNGKEISKKVSENGSGERIFGKKSSSFYYLLGTSTHIFSVSSPMELKMILGEAKLYIFNQQGNRAEYPNEPYFPWVGYTSNQLEIGFYAFILDGIEMNDCADFYLEGDIGDKHSEIFAFVCVSRDRFVDFCLGNENVISQLPPAEESMFFALAFIGYGRKVTVNRMASMQGASFYDYGSQNWYTVDLVEIILPNNRDGTMNTVLYPSQFKGNQEIFVDGEVAGVVFKGLK